MHALGENGAKRPSSRLPATGSETHKETIADQARQLIRKLLRRWTKPLLLGKVGHYRPIVVEDYANKAGIAKIAKPLISGLAQRQIVIMDWIVEQSSLELVPDRGCYPLSELGQVPIKWCSPG